MFRVKIEVLAVECVDLRGLTDSVPLSPGVLRSLTLIVGLQRRGARHCAGTLAAPGSVAHSDATSSQPIPLQWATQVEDDNGAVGTLVNIRNVPSADALYLVMEHAGAAVLQSTEDVPIDGLLRRVGVRWVPLVATGRPPVGRPPVVGAEAPKPLARVRILWSMEPEDGTVFAASRGDYSFHASPPPLRPPMSDVPQPTAPAAPAHDGAAPDAAADREPVGGSTGGDSVAEPVQDGDVADAHTAESHQMEPQAAAVTSDAIQPLHYYERSTCRVEIAPRVAAANLYACCSLLGSIQSSTWNPVDWSAERGARAAAEATKTASWVQGKPQRLQYVRRLLASADIEGNSERVSRQLQSTRLGAVDPAEVVVRGSGDRLVGGSSAGKSSFSPSGSLSGTQCPPSATLTALARIRADPTSAHVPPEAEARLREYGIHNPPLPIHEPIRVTFNLNRIRATL